MFFPRWFKPTFYVGLGLGLGGILYTAYRGGYDVTETIGFVATTASLIFIVFVLVLTALAAVVLLIGKRRHLAKVPPRERRMATTYMLSIPVQCFAIGFALWHPLGWFWSGTIAAIVYGIAVVAAIVAVWLFKGLSREDRKLFQDRLLTEKNESDPLYFVP
jgi:drug/metabolite transporter (DMT)-like permease